MQIVETNINIYVATSLCSTLFKLPLLPFVFFSIIVYRVYRRRNHPRHVTETSDLGEHAEKHARLTRLSSQAFTHASSRFQLANRVCARNDSTITRDVASNEHRLVFRKRWSEAPTVWQHSLPSKDHFQFPFASVNHFRQKPVFAPGFRRLRMGNEDERIMASGGSSTDKSVRFKEACRLT